MGLFWVWREKSYAPLVSGCVSGVVSDLRVGVRASRELCGALTEEPLTGTWNMQSMYTDIFLRTVYIEASASSPSAS